MEEISFYLTAAAAVIVFAAWFVFAGTFWFRKKPRSAPDAKRAPKSFVGIALQGVSFGLVSAVRRAPFFSPLVGEQFALNIIFQILAIFIVVGAVWMAGSAVRELGKQWSFQARLIEDHKLITGGVYQIVRHPIYAAMFGILISIGLVVSHWAALIIGVIIFLIGTKIRVNSEEKLLRDAFPNEYEEYARRVPAFIPFLKF